MSEKYFGIFKSSSVIKIEKAYNTDSYKNFSYFIEIESGPSKNGNGTFYMKIFTHGEFKEIAEQV